MGGVRASHFHLHYASEQSDPRGFGVFCCCRYGCKRVRHTGAEHEHSERAFHEAREQRASWKVPQKGQCARTGPEGSDLRSHFRDSDRAGEGQLLYGHSQRQMGCLHRGCDQEVSGIAWTEFYGQAGREDLAKARPWLANLRSRPANAAGKLVLSHRPELSLQRPSPTIELNSASTNAFHS